MEIKYELTKTPKEKPTGALGFGHIFTDHMFVMDYDEGKGWHDARIVPYQPLVLDPSALVFHYAQECFEGLKAYRTPRARYSCSARTKTVRAWPLPMTVCAFRRSRWRTL